MPARRRHYPGRAPAAGMSGTRAAYDICARPECRHARVKHTAGGTCTAVLYYATARPPGVMVPLPGCCTCPAFSESEE